MADVSLAEQIKALLPENEAFILITFNFNLGQMSEAKVHTNADPNTAEYAIRKLLEEVEKARRSRADGTATKVEVQSNDL